MHPEKLRPRRKMISEDKGNIKTRESNGNRSKELQYRNQTPVSYFRAASAGATGPSQ